MSRQTMDWRVIGRLCVTVHTADEPAEAEWNEYMKGVRRQVPMADQKVVVISAGGGPNGKQRKMMTDELEGTRVPVAILTDSWLMRSAGIAVSWFNPMLKVLPPRALEEAFTYLELTTWEREESRLIIRELQKKLGVNVIPNLRGGANSTSGFPAQADDHNRERRA
jgi:hypothetical protein